MAKISAHGAHKVAEARRRDVDGDDTWEMVLVLCSDGRILGRTRLVGHHNGGSYSVRGKVPPGRAPLATFRAFAESMAYEVL